MISTLVEGWEPGEASRPFWEAASRGELVLQRCKACNRFQHPPRMFCIACGELPVFVPAQGSGTVYSFTVVERALLPELRPLVPYVLALVDLVEGVRMTSVIRGIEPADARIGMAVSVEYARVGEVSLPVFGPDAKS